MAKLILYDREIEVRTTLPEIFVVNPDDVEFLMFKADQLFSNVWAGEPPPASSYKVDGRLEIDLTGAFVTGLTMPAPALITEPQPFRGLWRARALHAKLGLSVDWGIER